MAEKACHACHLHYATRLNSGVRAAATMMRSLGYVLAFLALATGLCVLGIHAYDLYRRPVTVAEILKIPSPPSTMRVVACKSPFVTDVVITCSVEIDPRQFEDLLAGYKFNHATVSQTSHTVAAGTRVGPEFQVSDQWQVRPKEFTDGGSVTVSSDMKRTRAIVDLYIE